MSNKKYCAVCGISIDNDYYIVGDNYLQVKYFDDEENNMFCSKDCLCKSLSVLNIVDGESYDVG